MDKAVIIFAYHFPPENTIGALRPYRFFKYLPQHGYTPIVVTASPQSTPNPNIIVVNDEFQNAVRKGFAWHCERAIRKLFMPGEIGITWSIRAAEAARKHIDAARYSHVATLSTFPPVGCHLAALRLVTEYRLPWIADFRDPFSMDPGRLRFHNWLQRMATGTLDRNVIQRSALLIANTHMAQQDWQERYPQYSHKVRLLWNGFDPEPGFPRPAPEMDIEPAVVRHVGSLYGGRDVLPIIEAIDRIQASGVDVRSRVKLELIGPADTSTAAVLNESAVVSKGVHDGWLNLLLSRVPRDVALKLMQTAFGLVLVQQHSTSQVPAKLYEYIRLQRPILAFLCRGSASEYVMVNAGVRHVVVYADDTPAEMEEKVQRFLQFTPAPQPPLRWFLDNFNGEHHAETLAAMLDEVMGLTSKQPQPSLRCEASLPHLR